MIMCSSLRLVDKTTIKAQDSIEPSDVFSLDNATISSGLLSTCLEVSCTRYGGIPESEYLDSEILLLLSLDNMSWIGVKNYTFNDAVLTENVSKSIKICNTLMQPFPFDVEKGETLYVCIEYKFGQSMILTDRFYRTPSFAVVVPTSIIRPWYFTIDWTLPIIFWLLFLCLFTVFWISKRRKIEPMV